MNASEQCRHLHKGDPVSILHRVTDAYTSRRPARVVDVMSNGVRVRFLDGDGEEIAVKFNRVEVPETLLAQRTSKKVKPSRHLNIAPEPAMPFPTVTRVEVPVPRGVASTSSAAPPASTSSLDVWLEMGREVAHDIDSRLATIEGHLTAIQIERSELDAREAQLVEEKQGLSQKRASITALLGSS